MTASHSEFRPSSRPDAAVVDRILMFEFAALVAVVATSGAILVTRLLPDYSPIDVDPTLMKANSAIALLLLGGGLALTRPRHGDRARTASAVCAVFAILIACSALLAHLNGRASWLETFLVDDPTADMPGLMAIQTAVSLIMMAVILLLERSRNRALGHAVDALTMALVIMVLLIATGYIFGATNLVGQTRSVVTSPQTLACLILLGFVCAGRRTRSGFFSVFAGTGIGSQRIRRAFPIALLLPIVIASISFHASRVGLLSEPVAAALMAALTAAMFFVFLVFEAWAINALDRELRDISLTDELTKVHNRRAFYVLGEQAIRVARRTSTPLSVLYFDLDGLKQVNDGLGHDAGSQLLLDFANLLRATFRATDIVARVGGDEFVVVSNADESHVSSALRRLEDSVAAANGADNAPPYSISYSVGVAFREPDRNESLAEIVERADAAMFERKRNKQGIRDEPRAA